MYYNGDQNVGVSRNMQIEMAITGREKDFQYIRVIVEKNMSLFPSPSQPEFLLLFAEFDRLHDVSSVNRIQYFNCS